MYPLQCVMIGSSPALSDLATAVAANGVEVEARFADLAALRATWSAPPPGPKLLAFVLGSDDELVWFRQACDSFPGWPALVGVGGDYDPQTLFRVNRAGAAQILPVPWHPDDLAAALDRLAAQFGLSPRPGKVVTVFGVAEGAGAAVLAVNLAWESAEERRVPTALAEPLSRVGQLAQLLDVNPPQTTEDLYATGSPTPAAVRQVLFPVTERLSLLTGPVCKFPAPTLDPARVVGAVEILRRSAGVIVLDLPTQFDDTCLELLSRSDEVVLVGSQRVPSLQALKQVHDALAARPRASVLHLVVNRYDPDREGLDEAHLRKVLEVEQLWTIAADGAAYAAAVNAGRPFRVSCPGSPAHRDVERLAAHLFGPPTTAGGRSGPGFLERWFWRGR